MPAQGLRTTGFALLLSAVLGWSGPSLADAPQTSRSRVEAALENLATLDRPGEEGLATIWDGNKYVQCRRTPDRALYCEAAGVRMQPSLAHVLVPNRVARLNALGWRLDPSFGDYAQTFPTKSTTGQAADLILRTLDEGYGATIADLEVESDWIASEPCPPRNGPGQNLAGMINDAPAMAPTAIHACAYAPPSDETQTSASSTADLIGLYGARVAGEIQRLRVNIDRRIFVVLDTDVGYVQCQPQTSPPAIYCEAESSESWPVLTSILTPERLARLHAAGYADPGRAPNYWKTYSADTYDDAAIAREVLTILHDVYGYGGSPKPRIVTEKDGDQPLP